MEDPDQHDHDQDSKQAMTVVCTYHAYKYGVKEGTWLSNGVKFCTDRCQKYTILCISLPPICTKFYPGHQSVQNVTPYCISFDTNLCKILPSLTTMFPPLHRIFKRVYRPVQRRLLRIYLDITEI